MITNTSKQERIAIIGAGLGGLACAIALHKQGYNVQVYEKAQDFRPVGGGLGLLPNGLKCLDAIEPGIVEEIASSGCNALLRNRKQEIAKRKATKLTANESGRFF